VRKLSDTSEQKRNRAK